MADNKLTFGQQIGLNAATSAANGVVSGAFGLAQGALQHKYNKEMADYQFDKNLEMWRTQNDYNTPQAQRERLEAAGLNPALMYGGGATSTGNSMSSPSYQMNPVDLVGTLQNAMMTDIQMKQIQANIDKTESETNLIDEQTKGQKITNQYSPALAQANIDKLISGRKLDEANVSKTYEDIKYLGVSMREIESRILVNNETLSKLQVETSNERKKGELMDLQKTTEALQQTLISEQTKTESSKRYQMESSAYRDLSQASLMDYQAEAVFAKLPLELAQLSAGTDKLEAETENVSVDTIMKEFKNKYYDMYGVFPDANQQQFVLQTLLSGNPDVEKVGKMYRRNLGADTYQKAGIGTAAFARTAREVADALGNNAEKSRTETSYVRDEKGNVTKERTETSKVKKFILKKALQALITKGK